LTTELVRVGLLAIVVHGRLLKGLCALDVAVGQVEQETQRWLLRANTMLRTIQVLPWCTVLFSWNSAAYYHPWLVVGLYLTYCGWSAFLFTTAMRRESMTVANVLADVVIVAGSVVVVGLTCRPGFAQTWQNWTIGPVIGAGILAVLYIGVRAGATVIGVLVLAALLPLLQDLGHAFELGTFLANETWFIACVAAVFVVMRRLNRSAAQADLATREALDARASEARTQERVRQYDILHTNVLTTLTLVARSTGDLGPELRDRCARDATYLRSVVNSVIDASPMGLNATLAEVIFAQGAHGLNIHYSVDELPHDLPSEVITAVSSAVTEALNNVAKYAGPAREAWVVATGERDPRQVTVTVTDRGHGFDTATTGRGFGLTRTITEGITAVGGRTRIWSRPGQGTSVEIQWTESSTSG
jgi:signal transduction histidine kinase